MEASANRPVTSFATGFDASLEHRYVNEMILCMVEILEVAQRSSPPPSPVAAGYLPHEMTTFPPCGPLTAIANDRIIERLDNPRQCSGTSQSYVATLYMYTRPCYDQHTQELSSSAHALLIDS